MNKLKKAFTLAEVLLVIVIIGIVMALSVQTFKMVKASYTSLSYYAYENIQTLVTAVYTGSAVPSPAGLTAAEYHAALAKSPVMNCKLPNGITTPILKGVNVTGNAVPTCSSLSAYNSDLNQSPTFCENLVEISSTTGKTNCSRLFNITKVTGEPLIANDYSPAAQKTTEAYRPNFITTNGYRYYVSKWDFDSNISDTFGYRLVAVDINASSHPNTNVPSGSTPPDVVTFIIFDNGEVLPLGVAADNFKVPNSVKYVNYLSSKLNGYYLEDKARTDKSTIPPECTAVDPVTKKNVQVCNFSVVNVDNPSSTGVIGSDKVGKKVFSFRQAYCYSHGAVNNPSAADVTTHGYANNLTYKKYCNNISGLTLCPPSTDPKAFNYCTPVIIKPVFRYKF